MHAVSVSLVCHCDSAVCAFWLTPGRYARCASWAGSAGFFALTVTAQAGILRQAFMCVGMPAQPVQGLRSGG